MLLLIICFALVSIVFSNNITCIGNNECRNQEVNCNQNEDCDIKCHGSFACDRATINCPSNGDCNIECKVNKFSCSYSTINCPSNGACNILGGSHELNGFTGANIYCPSVSGKCTFSCSLQKGCTGPTIHGGAGDLDVIAAPLASGINNLDDTTVYCPTNRICNIKIQSTTRASFRNSRIYGKNASELNIVSTGSGGQDFNNSIIECPYDDIRGNAIINCNINLVENQNTDFDGVQFYTAEGINDINIDCESACYSDENEPLLYCQDVDVNQNCAIHAIDDNYNVWQCTDPNICTDHLLYTPTPTQDPTIDPTSMPTSCFNRISVWKMQAIGTSSQFKFYNFCNDNQFVKVKLDSLIEYDNNGKATKNRINSFARAYFHFEPDEEATFQDKDGNVFEAVKNTFNSTLSVGQGNDKKDVPFIFDTLVFYDDNENTAKANTLKWNVDIMQWPFLNMANTLELCVNIMTNGGELTLDDFVLESPIMAIYDDIEKDNVDIFQDPQKRNENQRYFCYTFGSFNKSMDYDPFIALVGDKAVEIESAETNIVFISVVVIVGFISAFIGIFLIEFIILKNKQGSANVVQLSELTSMSNPTK